MVAFTDVLSNMIWRALLSYPGIVGLTRKFSNVQISCGKAEIRGNGSLSLDSATQTAATSPIEQTHRGKTPVFSWDTSGFLSAPVTCWFWDFNYISQLSFLSCHMHTSHKSYQLACRMSPSFHHNGPCILVSLGPYPSFPAGNTDCFCSSHPAAMNPDVNQRHARFWEPSLLKQLQDPAVISSWLFFSARDVPSAQNVCPDVLSRLIPSSFSASTFSGDIQAQSCSGTQMSPFLSPLNRSPTYWACLQLNTRALPSLPKLDFGPIRVRFVLSFFCLFTCSFLYLQSIVLPNKYLLIK